MTRKTIGQADGGGVGIVNLRLAHTGLEIFHSSHLGIGGLVGLGMLPHFRKQLLPHHDKGMGSVFEQEPHMIGNHFSIALNHLREIHKGVVDLACGIDGPHLTGLS